MQMRTSIQIKSVLKALTDVVLPAVDPANKPAQEQIRLAIGMLSLMAQQLPLQFRFDCDELARLLALSDELQAGMAAGGEATAPLVALADVSRSATQTIERARATPEEVELRVRQMRAAIGKFVTQTFREGTAERQGTVGKAVLAMSKEQLLRDRAMLLMQGWEPDPKAIPSITALLDGARA